MSSQPPRPVGTTVPGQTATQGMIAPLNPFVDAGGLLTGVSFRFLFELFHNINQLQSEVQTLQQRLANAGIP